MNVWYNSNQNAQLSNLAYRPFRYWNTDFVTVEHAYQTLKSGTFDHSCYNRPWAPGRKYRGSLPPKTANDWNIKLMFHLVYESFMQNPEASRTLRATAPEPITHHQGDRIWAHYFPRILEAVRVHVGA